MITDDGIINNMLKKKYIKTVIIMSLITLTALFGLASCSGQSPENDPNTDPAPEEEPVDGEGTYTEDPNAPKEIKSKIITSFSTEFFLATRWKEGEDHYFKFKIGTSEDGDLNLTEAGSGLTCDADEELIKDVQAIIDKYSLASYNGVYENNGSLPPEYHGYGIEATYDSGEKLKFTIMDGIEALWKEEMTDLFARYFSEEGAGDLYPQEISTVNRLNITFKNGDKWYEYGGITVPDSEAIEGETYLLEKTIYDESTEEMVFEKYILFPIEYYDEITNILQKYDIVNKYDFSAFNHAEGDYSSHDLGYYGWGGDPSVDEPDSEEFKLDMYVEYRSGNRLSIETSKESEISGIKPLLDELTEYHDALFDQ